MLARDHILLMIHEQNIRKQKEVWFVFKAQAWPRWAELNEAVEQLMDFQITKVYFISIIIQTWVREKKSKE